ncbi:hypothetical protein CDAR_177901 [Caerostris darwini]|uniref:Uncharacterized protein n=1 Tax=Caerostris darwini TaxID=1538125 RepID=A0AAV4WHA7_9ARAC|nr:hypothetical protein CDAR_177901 [Caerostris darwini]
MSECYCRGTLRSVGNGSIRPLRATTTLGTLSRSGDIRHRIRKLFWLLCRHNFKQRTADRYRCLLCYGSNLSLFFHLSDAWDGTYQESNWGNLTATRYFE